MDGAAAPLLRGDVTLKVETHRDALAVFHGLSTPVALIILAQLAIGMTGNGRGVLRGSRPPVKLTWYDGGLLPPKPEELAGEELNKTGGALLVGSKGKLLHETYGRNPRLLPRTLHESFGTPLRKLERIPDENHEMNWADAAKGHTEPSCPFAYAARLTEVMLLGVVALRAGRKISYDGERMRVTNDDRANEYLQRNTPRAGWTL